MIDKSVLRQHLDALYEVLRHELQELRAARMMMDGNEIPAPESEQLLLEGLSLVSLADCKISKGLYLQRLDK